MNKRVAIIGAGQLGTVLATVLHTKKVSIVAIASRTLSSATELAQRIGSVVATAHPHEVLSLADIFFLTTPDDQITSICEKMTRDTSDLSGKIFFHCSGSLPAEALMPAKTKNAFIGAMHPLQTFSFPKNELPEHLFRGILMAIDGDTPAVQLAVELASLLEAIPIELNASQKALYHAAAVLVSNYSSVLMEMALQLFKLAGIDSDKGLPALTTLCETTLQNIQTQGPVSALTGPIARGDIHTVTSHINALRTYAPTFLPAYAELGLLAVSVADKKGCMDSTTKEKLGSLFSSI